MKLEWLQREQEEGRVPDENRERGMACRNKRRANWESVGEEESDGSQGKWKTVSSQEILTDELLPGTQSRSLCNFGKRRTG